MSKNTYTETLAVVQEVLENGSAVCQQGVYGICGTCDNKSDSCGETQHLDKKKKPISLTVANTLGAKKGQVVRIGIPTASILKSVFIAYLLPLVFIIVGAFLGEYYHHSDLAAVIGCFLGLAIGFFVASYLSKILMKTIWSPKMLGIIDVPNNCNLTTNNTTNDR